MSAIDDGLTTKALEYLATQPDIWAERRNAGKKRRVHLGDAGTPDIMGRIQADPWALPFGIETKAKKGKLRETQVAYHARMREWGIPICVAYSLNDVKEFVAWLRGAREKKR